MGYVYVKNKKTKPGELGHWGENKRVEAVTTYLATGNLALTSRIINVPTVTVRTWAASDWWIEMVHDLQREEDTKLKKSLQTIVDKGLNAVNDILENGEVVYNPKTGKTTRVAPRLRDVNKVTNDMIERQLAIKKQQANKITVSKESTEGMLKKLAEEFAKIALKKNVEQDVVMNVVEGEYEELPPNYQEALKYNLATTVDWDEHEKNVAIVQGREYAIHDQREEGLQEGAGLGAQEEAQESERQSFKEQSESRSGR